MYKARPVCILSLILTVILPAIILSMNTPIGRASSISGVSPASAPVPIPVSQVVTDVFQAAQNSAWVIMPDYSFTQLQAYGQYHQSARKCHGAAAAVTDSYATTYLMGKLANPQNVILDTNPAYVSQMDCGSPSAIPASNPIVTIAGPGVNEAVFYYTSTSAQSQLYYDFTTNCIVKRDTSASVACDPGSSAEDYFVVEAFTDSQGRAVYMLWGKGYLGTLASVAYMVGVVAQNPATYSSSWYVVRWDDAGSGPSANGIPDPGDSYTILPTNSFSPALSGYANVAWQYFVYGNGINPTSKLPRGWIGGNLFTFWDFGLALDGTVAGYKAALIGQTEYTQRVGALLSFLMNMQVNTDGTPYYAYYWDTGAPVSSQGYDAADSGRIFNALGYLRRQDPKYSPWVDSLATGNLQSWFNAICAKNWGLSIYARDVALGCHYFRYLNSQYDMSTYFSNFNSAWTSTDRITDAYGNSLPKLREVNFGPVAYELLEQGEDYSRTMTYASDMKGWALKRYEATGKYSLWGTELHVKLADGSTPFAWEFYEAYVPNVGYKTWQVKLANGQWLDESDPTIASTVSSLDAAYAAKTAFPGDSWISSIFPAFAQNTLQTSSGFYEAVLEATSGPETTSSVSHNAVILLAMATG